MSHKIKFATVFSIVLITLMIISIPVSVTAQEGNETGELEDLNATTGESLSVAIDSSATDLSSEIDKRAFDALINKADSDEERVDIANEQLNSLEKEVNEVNKSYSEAITEERNGAKASKIAHSANKANQINDKLNEVEYILNNVNESTVNNTSIDKVDNLRSELSISGSESAGVVRDSMMSNGLEVRMIANNNGIDVAANASGENVFKGMERRSEAHGEFNINETEASEIASNEVSNESAELIDIQKHKKGSYEVNFDDNGTVTNVVVDGRDGEVTKISERKNIPEQAKENIPSFVFGEDGKIGQGPPENIGERGPPEWAGQGNERNDNSDNRNQGGQDNRGDNDDKEDVEQNENREKR